MRNWQTDVELDVPIAHGIVSRQFPQFTHQQPTYLGRGWDNFCLEYPDGTVFRLPSRKLGAELTAIETAALPALKDRLPLPIPEVLHCGVPQGDYPYAFIGYRKLPGRTADQLDWTPEARQVAARQLGEFLKELHSIDTTAKTLASLPKDNMAKAMPDALLKRIHQRTEQLRNSPHGVTELMQRALNQAVRLADQPNPKPKQSLVHGDLYPRHILATDDLILTGVIDWGDMHIGDPAIDLSLAYSFLEAEERPAFWGGYGEPPKTTVIILRAAMYGFALIAYGVDESDAPATAMGEQILRRTVV